MNQCQHMTSRSSGRIYGLAVSVQCRCEALPGQTVCRRHTAEALAESKRKAMARSDKQWERRRKWRAAAK